MTPSSQAKGFWGVQEYPKTPSLADCKSVAVAEATGRRSLQFGNRFGNKTL
jgi:hypothetical protein